MVNTKNVDSKELKTFIQDVRDDLNNLDDLVNYYDFLGQRVDVLEIIRAQLPQIRKKLSE